MQKSDEQKNKENNNMISSVKVLAGNLRLDFKAFQTTKINHLISNAFDNKQEICVLFCVFSYFSSGSTKQTNKTFIQNS
jgi:hypothetical protein